MVKLIIISSFIISTMIMVSGCSSPDKADLIIKNARIVTVDETIPSAEAIAVKGDRILAVGNFSDLEQNISDDTKIIDAKGKLLIPGFIDSHAHFLGLGASLVRLDLTKAKSWDDVVSIVNKAVAGSKPGEWILGRGWHQEKWDILPDRTVKGFPVHADLSKISPDNPVVLTHASGHALIANQKAMQVAGVDENSLSPEGGEIVRFTNNKPSGVFLENAELLIQDVFDTLMGKRTKQEVFAERHLKMSKAAEHCLSLGITSFYDAGSTLEEVDFYKKLADENQLPLRLWLMLHEENEVLRENIADYRLINYGKHHLTVRAIKRYMDGALGARGAWLLEPYSDLPSTSGLNTISVNDFTESAEIAATNGFQLCTHAIGDRANREVLNVYKKFIEEYGNEDWRWRIEHAQHLDPLDIPRFAELGVIAAMQGIHCTSDGPWVPKRIGDKRAEQGAYVWRSLLESGALICNGTDAPVEAVDPFANFHALITREMRDGTRFYPKQAMSRMEALKSYTINGAYSGFEEDVKGSITPGKLADFIILSDDIMVITEEKIPDVQVLYTFVGGEMKYDAAANTAEN